MKKLITAAMLLAVSGGALAQDYTAGSNWNNITDVRDNLATIYNNLQANSWGQAGSNAGSNALGGLFVYTQSINTVAPGGEAVEYVSPSVTIGMSTTAGQGFVSNIVAGTDAVSATLVELDESIISTHVDALTTGVMTDVFGGTDLSNYVSVDTSIGIPVFSVSGGIAESQFNTALGHFSSGAVLSANFASLSTGSTSFLNQAYETAQGLFVTDIAGVNDAIEAVHGLGNISITDGNITDYQVPTVSGQAFFQEHDADGNIIATYCSATDWAAKITSEQCDRI